MTFPKEALMLFYFQMMTDAYTAYTNTHTLSQSTHTHQQNTPCEGSAPHAIEQKRPCTCVYVVCLLVCVCV